MPHTGIALDRHTRPDLDLQTNVRGVHGVHAYCACGWEGRVQKTWAEAQRDAKVHRGWHKMQERGL
jgi:hypothetical protein